MRVAVVSDLHANLQALQAVDRDIARQNVDQIWSLGDVLGYGGNPLEVLAWVERNTTVALQGNHDLAVVRGDTKSFNPLAAGAANHHSAALPEPAQHRVRAWLPSANRTVDGFNVLLVHASPDDPTWEYVSFADVPRGIHRWSGRADVILLGHTHQPFAATTAGAGWGLDGFTKKLESEPRASSPLLIVNPGSVGQPRDGDPRASYALLDFQRRTVSLQRVAYDVAAAEHAILTAGMHPLLGKRLHTGV